MKVIKWLDEHFEEFILIVFLVHYFNAYLLQVICRNVPHFQSNVARRTVPASYGLQQCSFRCLIPSVQKRC